MCFEEIKCENCGHCVDLGGCPGGCQDPSALEKGREIVKHYVGQWLK